MEDLKQVLTSTSLSPLRPLNKLGWGIVRREVVRRNHLVEQARKRLEDR